MLPESKLHGPLFQSSLESLTALPIPQPEGAPREHTLSQCVCVCVRARVHICASVCLCLYVSGLIAPMMDKAFYADAPIFFTQNAEGFNQLGDL